MLRKTNDVNPAIENAYLFDLPCHRNNKSIWWWISWCFCSISDLEQRLQNINKFAF